MIAPAIVVATAVSYALGWAIGIPLLVPVFNTLAAFPFMVAALSRGDVRLAVARMLVWALALGVCATLLSYAQPWRTDALFLPETRARFRALTHLGLTDAIRANTDDGGLYTFWDYQAGAWQKNWGLRIDHLLLSPQASDRLIDVGIDSYVRAWEKPSDHVPVWADFDLET